MVTWTLSTRLVLRHRRPLPRSLEPQSFLELSVSFLGSVDDERDNSSGVGAREIRARFEY